MGQGYSYKNTSTPAPLEILSDPAGASHFVCMRNAPSSKNYNVYKDHINGPLWLFVKKTGHTLQNKNPSTLILENFNKEILCVASLEPKSDNFFNPTYTLKNLVKSKIEGQPQVGATKHETIKTVAHDQLEWKCQTRATIRRSHSMTEYLAEVYVEAVGLVTRETQKVRGRDSENLPSIRTVFKETKQVDRAHYVIHLAGGEDLYFSLDDPNCSAPNWKCPMFNAAVLESSSGERRWEIDVKAGYEAGLSLLIGLVCSSVLTPEKIKNYVPVRWS